MSGTIWRTTTFDPPVTVQAGQSIRISSPGSRRPFAATTWAPVSTARHSDGSTSDVWVVGNPKRQIADPPPDDVFPCFACGHRFNHVLLGRYGCPNCHGEGLGPRVHP